MNTILQSLKDRIFGNPKSTFAALVAGLAMAAAHFGFQVSAEDQLAVTAALMVIYGLLKTDRPVPGQ